MSERPPIPIPWDELNRIVQQLTHARDEARARITGGWHQVECDRALDAIARARAASMERAHDDAPTCHVCGAPWVDGACSRPSEHEPPAPDPAGRPDPRTHPEFWTE